MSLYEEDDYQNMSDVELDEDEQGGEIIIPGQLVFMDLYQPGSAAEEYEPRYGATFRLPKGSEYGKKLFQVVEAVAQKTWKRDAEEKLQAVWDGVDKGVAPKNSNINIQDGDLFNREYNSGSWQIKTSRRLDEGPPKLFGVNGEVVIWDEDDRDSVTEAKKVGPKKGDYCYFGIRVWGQRSRERINFSLEAVRVAERGKLRVSGDGGKKLISKFGDLKGLPSGFKALALPSGEEDDVIEAEVVKGKAKPAAKVAVKAKPVRKGVFRRK